VSSQCYRSSPGDEIGGPNLSVVDQTNDHRIGDERTKLFDQIEGQCRPAVPGLMEEAEGRIKACANQRPNHFLSQHRIKEGGQRIARIAARAPTAGGEIKRAAGGVADLEHSGKVGEVIAGSASLDAKELLETYCLFRSMPPFGKPMNDVVLQVSRISP